ncbi:MAG: amidohydrolase family protein [Cyclobacteriaceae bacterium]
MKTTIKILAIAVGVFLFTDVAAQVPEPVADQSGPIILMNGVAHLGNGEIIENSAIAFENGKITLVGDARVMRLDLSKYEVVDAAGKHIYPGLILPNTTLGLEEISAVRATRDHTEVGEITPNVRSLVAYNTDSELIAALRYNGILLAQPTPRGGVITGTSSIMMLEGWNWEDAAYMKDDGVHLDWPSKTYGARWWMGETSGRENPRYAETVARVEQFMAEANAYAQVTNPEVTNLKLEAMKGVISGEQRLFIHADARDEILESITLAKRMSIPNIVLVGARDAYYCTSFIKEHNVPILLDMVHRLPSREDEDVDLSYKLAGLLHNQGIKVGLTYPSLQSSRNLPFFAGTAVAYGLDKEEALKLVTSNTAEILGIGAMTGTISEGKDANLVVSEGDLLDMRTSKVKHAFIKGRSIQLEGKQQVLYDRFKRKYSEDK